MALSVKAGIITAPAGTGSQAYTGIGFQPSAVLFFTARQTADGTTGGSHGCVGAATSSAQRWCMAFADDDAVTTANSGYYADSASCVIIPSSGTPALIGKADFVTLDANGFTLNWTTATGITGIVVGYLAFGGSDILNAKAGTWTPPTTTGNQGVTDPGFRPDFCFYAWPFLAAPSGAVDAHASLGMAARVPLTRAATSWFSNDGGAAGKSDEAIVQNAALCICGHDATSSAATTGDLFSFDTTGFTINWTAISSTASKVGYYLALRGGQYSVGTTAQRTTTGTTAISGLPFTPRGVFFASSGQASDGTSNTAADVFFSVGAGDSPTSRNCHSFYSADAVATTIQKRSYAASRVVRFVKGAAPTTLAEADLQSVDATGFTLNWTPVDATARRVFYAAFGDSVVPFPPPPRVISQAVKVAVR